MKVCGNCFCITWCSFKLCRQPQNLRNFIQQVHVKFRRSQGVGVWGQKLRRPRWFCPHKRAIMVCKPTVSSPHKAFAYPPDPPLFCKTFARHEGRGDGVKKFVQTGLLRTVCATKALPTPHPPLRWSPFSRRRRLGRRHRRISSGQSSDRRRQNLKYSDFRPAPKAHTAAPAWR